MRGVRDLSECYIIRKYKLLFMRVHSILLAAGVVNRGVHGNDFVEFRWSEGRLWDKKYSSVAPRGRFWPILVRQRQVTGATMAKRIFASSPWHLTVDKDLGHRRLNVGQLPTLISHRTVRFSPYSGWNRARWGSRAVLRDMYWLGISRTHSQTHQLPCACHTRCAMCHSTVLYSRNV